MPLSSSIPSASVASPAPPSTVRDAVGLGTGRAPAPAPAFRPEIQGLRALAVLLVFIGGKVIVAEMLGIVLGTDRIPVRLRAWDGSETGPAGSPLVELRTPDAIRRLLWHPGELGAAQAYVTGELEVHHDLDEALTPVCRGFAPVVG